ncbi:general secretion pathway protein C [Xenophilus arseniciresistens]|uniref:General secretion pathway protein C n=1 Tax=Xenophilus arseniciresistens TaxID=1283306 RepID=A0AAE3SZR3_9BURK|nr:general secretion pathway protein C [Xenophilus arseniciresistens]MDA7416765.1 general secretion pathway protein C [Xenophilus arseniciresistens]
MSVLNAPAPWPSAACTALLWAAAAGSVVFWGLRLAAPAEASLPPVAAAAPLQTDAAAVASLLGAPGAAAPASRPQVDPASRFRLLGVVADDRGSGAALLAVDGKPARPFRAGAALGDGYVLQAVEGRSARIGVAGSPAAPIVLELPALAQARNAPPRGAAVLSND